MSSRAYKHKSQQYFNFSPIFFLQIFINYLGDGVDGLRCNRRRFIEKYWQFHCECDRCEPLASRSEQMKNQRNLFADLDYKYFERHREDIHLPPGNERRNHLKQICAQILNKYGHIWSNELNDVTMFFIIMNQN